MSEAPAGAPAQPTQPTSTPATPTGEPATPPSPQPSTTGTPPATPAQGAAPETYDLKVPDGSPLDPSEVDKIAAFARSRGLSNEQAQVLLEQRHEGASELSRRQAETLTKYRNEWEQQVRNDPELGGEKFDATLKQTKLVMDRFAPEGSKMREILNETGYGNHPEFVRFVASIGKAMSEDKPFSGAPAGGESAPKSPADVLYGGDK